jgi:hypothetical protein
MAVWTSQCRMNKVWIEKMMTKVSWRRRLQKVGRWSHLDREGLVGVGMRMGEQRVLIYTPKEV